MSKRTSIRIPDGLYAQLVERAKSDQRSVSNLIITLLNQALKSQHTAHDPADKKSADPI